MSELTEELPAKVITAWRNFAATPEFQKGVDWLRHNRAPDVNGATEIEILKSALGFKAYMKALEDVQDVLTKIPTAPANLEEPSINA